LGGSARPNRRFGKQLQVLPKWHQAMISAYTAPMESRQRRSARVKKGKPRHAGGVGIALRAGSGQPASAGEAETQEAHGKQRECRGFGSGAVSNW